MDLTSHNKEEKAKLQSAIDAINANDFESAKNIIQECIAGEDKETEMDKEEKPTLKQKFQKAMGEGKELGEAEGKI